MLRFFNTVFARIALSLACVVALGLLGVDRLLHRTSIDAVVNAPRLDVVAPVEGVLATLPTRPGESVAAGVPVATLQRAAWSHGVEDEIGSRVGQLRARLAALDLEARSLRRLRDELRARVARHRATSMTQLAEEERSVAATAAERRTIAERVEALRAVSGTTDAEVQQAQAASVSANATLARVREARRAAASGLVTGEVGGGAQDVPYSQQRLDDVAVRLAQLAAERASTAAALASLDGQLPAPVAATPGTLALSSPSAGVVWSVPHAPGSLVMKGAVVATLVDCADVFLEARVSARDEAAIRPGQPVTFRFVGDPTPLRGTVAYVRGGAVRDEAPTVARLATEANAATDGRVVITPDVGAMGAAPRNFCQVGRSARVTFDRAGGGAPRVAAR